MLTEHSAWLADTLRDRGLHVVELENWHDRGHGDLQSVWGVICHHTGSDDVSAEVIAEGRPDLPGPLANVLVAQDGTITVVAQGVAYHAGGGHHEGLPDNDATAHTIGVQAANDGTQPYPAVQYDALVRCCAAIIRTLGVPASHVIGHKEWSDDKVDPALDMDLFRRDVAESYSAASPSDPKGW